ncbi:ElaB/YqjD/DUF883 family membrane-anchored ribosome-binding protein [Pseudomonas duriflava]|uniref:ElaB/YqjD/DUF883 family membrane-anchored ribosome-binding protein n=1 Tax=Pseudomonas duriflava TaxID=459528 RepID=A0A562QG35_9PSED|nr:DUF883 family protein [Pseudomonas duriflava]TWI55715.1 ElaB/YqjD/DUF883 family membrane-anchored ribosome-binding protein [Pseudomonas duriflava]
MTMESTLPPSRDDEQSSGTDKQTHREHLHEAQDALSAEFATLIADAEKLLKHTASSASSQVEELRSRLNETLGRTKEAMMSRQSSVSDQSRAALEATEDYVIEHPLKAVGIAAGIGFVVGLLFSRR